MRIHKIWFEWKLKLFLLNFVFGYWNWKIWLCCRQEIRTSTSSMTSVPKPLKFLRPHYGTLKAYYETMVESELKVLLFVSYSDDFVWSNSMVLWCLNDFSFVIALQKYLADILSVLALTMSAEGERVSLLYLEIEWFFF